ncbi:hypothetical protein T4C_5505 [Trichinella pseudospiralis]|uniref:Uncharacterized protein n=1 Tax=Trichinella pseudospiralis TaxID=6337 RepID=A0A0V1GK29_TRIPS|nr:hypothetical protein T4C_5505 [Trichinella pseudospiralis]
MKKKEEKWRKPREPRKPGSNRLLVSCICWSVAFVGQIEVSEDTLDGEDTIYRSRERNKRPILRYFLAMMTM